MLATIASSRSQQGLIVDPSLVEQIRAVYRDVNPKSLGNSAVAIASELIASCPDLAIELVEQSAAPNAPSQELDWAFTQLSLSALMADPWWRTGPPHCKRHSRANQNSWPTTAVSFHGDVVGNFDHQNLYLLE